VLLERSNGAIEQLARDGFIPARNDDSELLARFRLCYGDGIGHGASQTIILAQLGAR
jgi:hypothetical protein